MRGPECACEYAYVRVNEFMYVSCYVSEDANVYVIICTYARVQVSECVCCV